jgi:hypothetical protein
VGCFELSGEPVRRVGPSGRAATETDTAFTIGWKGRYRIEGPAFVCSDQESGRIITILGYPTDKLAETA